MRNYYYDLGSIPRTVPRALWALEQELQGSSRPYMFWFLFWIPWKILEGLETAGFRVLTQVVHIGPVEVTVNIIDVHSMCLGLNGFPEQNAN